MDVEVVQQELTVKFTVSAYLAVAKKHPIGGMTSMILQEFPTHTEERVATAVRNGLGSRAKRLPPWLFYDEAGSRLFDEITERPEYYLTRTEREIFDSCAALMIAQAAQGKRLRIVELGAGSADKTRLLLKAAAARQKTVVYEPLDVSASALEAARKRIEREIDGVVVIPQVVDYTHGLELEKTDERQLVLYIGSSIGNFEPAEAA
ncbi:MAG: L-histidine N(alpha)-methyltransferase, partial [Acidimicrobiales bacterium]